MVRFLTYNFIIGRCLYRDARTCLKIVSWPSASIRRFCSVAVGLVETVSPRSMKLKRLMDCQSLLTEERWYPKEVKRNKILIDIDESSD